MCLFNISFTAYIETLPKELWHAR